MSTIVSATRRNGYAHDVEIGSHSLIADEPESVGGSDTGPNPTRLLAASLASCTAITIEMYAGRKDWDLEDLRVDVEIDGSLVSGDATFEVSLHLPAGLDEDQISRIEKIAGKCPVHKAIAGETPVSITSRTAG